MTDTQFAFLFSFVIVFALGIRGVIKYAINQMREQQKTVDNAVIASGVKRKDVIEARSRPLIPVNKGYRAWFMYRVLNASGLDGVSRFIWRRRRNAWLIRGFFTRFR